MRCSHLLESEPEGSGPVWLSPVAVMQGHDLHLHLWRCIWTTPIDCCVSRCFLALLRASQRGFFITYVVKKDYHRIDDKDKLLRKTDIPKDFLLMGLHYLT